MPGPSDDDLPPEAPEAPEAPVPAEAPVLPVPLGDPVAASEVLEGLRSLHARLDELHQVVTQRLGPEGAFVTRAIPAWQRRTRGEMRWPVTLTSAVGVTLQSYVPGRLQLVHPTWALTAAQGALGVVLVAANPRRINRESMAIRMLGLVFAALLSLANGWSVASLAVGIVRGTMGQTAGPLLITGGAIWLTNVVVFALWYWEFDRGGPVARALNTTTRYPDFQFAQMVSPPVMVSPEWEPAFVDYLYLAFTNAAAFSPTDVLPLSRTAKIAMAVQSIISIVTVALVVARAVNILPVSA